VSGYHRGMPYAPVYQSADIRALEAAAQAPGGESLMERAGLAAADYACSVMTPDVRAVLVVAGPGNNGGDAFELAVHLKRRFYRVDVVFMGDSNKLPPDARAAYAKWSAAGGECMSRFPAGAPRRYGLVVDGLFGIGLARVLEGEWAGLVSSMRRCGVPVLALDVPSGINSDTGAVMGHAVRAVHTLTFIALKPGLLTLDGPDYCGTVHVDPLALDVEALRKPTGRLLSSASIASALQRRPGNFHKGNAGSVSVLGGATGMVGAALLAGRAALACGTGRVYVGMLAPDAPVVDLTQPELMLRRAEDELVDDAVIAAGPGMGQGEGAKALLERAIKASKKLVLDADALNLVAAAATFADAVSARTGETVMTPHPAEAARLLGTDTAHVQADRISAAFSIAKRFNAHVALKGNGTVVASPRGAWAVNPTGHAGMASAGMGDALTGIVASLLAQGAPAEQALHAAVWLHGAAGDAAAAECGALGTSATDVIAHARPILNRELQ
jgi:ADP-dependent NAD(P)H-hydrate dehydratase / NAD(P)H-hydrate epimerase